jgi:hypothetical protein
MFVTTTFHPAPKLRMHSALRTHPSLPSASLSERSSLPFRMAQSVVKYQWGLQMLFEIFFHTPIFKVNKTEQQIQTI